MVRGYGFFQYDQRFQGRFVIRFFEFSCHISSLPDFLSDKLLGEAMVPVSDDRQVLGPSLLNFDTRGDEFLEELAAILPDERLYAINGNTLGNQYSLTKLKWICSHQPELYSRTYKFLPWSA